MCCACYFFQTADSWCVWTSDRWMRKCTWKPAGHPASGTPSRSPFSHTDFLLTANTLHFVLHTLSPVNRSQASAFFLKYFLLLEKLVFPNNTSLLHFSWKKIIFSWNSYTCNITFSQLGTYFLFPERYSPWNTKPVLSSSWHTVHYFSPGNFLLPDHQTAFSPRTTSSLTLCTSFSLSYYFMAYFFLSFWLPENYPFPDKLRFTKEVIETIQDYPFQCSIFTLNY